LRRKARQQSLARGLAACFGSAARPDLGNLLAMGCYHKTPAFLAHFAEQAGKGAVCLGG
jgi:hypothetical protein